MARVVCTHVAMGWISGVLYSRVARTHSCLGGSVSQVDICGLKSRICRVVRKPQLSFVSGSNRRLLHEKRRLDSRTIIVVKK